jgi:hypothetical protein
MDPSPENRPWPGLSIQPTGPDRPEGSTGQAPPFWNPAKIALATMIALLLCLLAPDAPQFAFLFTIGEVLALLCTAIYARREHRLGCRVSEPLQLFIIAILTPAIPTIIVAVTAASAVFLLEVARTLSPLFKAGAAP